MPSTFSGVSTRMWSAALRRTSPEARLVRAYIATGPLKTTEGLFPLPLGYLISDTGLPQDEVERGLMELENERLIQWDGTHEVVLDREALVVANYTSEKDKRITAAVKLYRDLPDTPLAQVFLELAAELAPVLYRAIVHGVLEVTEAA